MKKFLLLISCLFALGIPSNAQSITNPYEYTFVKGTGNYFTATGTATFNNVKWNLTANWIASEYFNFDGNNAASQIGAAKNPASKITISTNDIPGTITGFSIEMWQTGKATYTGSISIGGTNIEINNNTTISLATKANSSAFTASGLNLSGEFKIEVTNSNTAKTGNGAFEIKSIKIEFTEEPVIPATVETPAISIDDQNMVSITCETEGAEIHYTINGDDPTADSQKYDAPFELTESATVKAIAIKGEDKSNIASKSFTVVEKKNSLANWTEWEEDVTFNITCPLTVIYKNGNNIFVKDAYNNYALVFNQNRITLPDYQNGDVINGMTAKFIVYSNSQLPEIIPVTVGEKTAGEPVIATEITATDVTAENFCHYVSLTGVSIVAGTQNKYFTLTDSEGVEATVYNQFNLDFTPEEGAVYDVIGVISAFKGQYQLQPVEITRALPEGGLDFTVENIENDSFVIGKDVESAKITVSGVHAESELYCKFTAAPAENPESAPRKAVDHTGYEKIERDADNNHTITVDGAGTLELYTYHPATDSKSDIRTINVTKEDGTTAIDSIASDVADGEAEYFNLQGVRINPENAAPGLYIRRQGGKAAKVMVK